MKKIIMVALVMIASASAFAKSHYDVKVLSRARDIVYFKVNLEMIGASMEVYNEKGDLIYSDTLGSKKIIVDFFDEPSGSYTIHVMKNGKEEVIEYLRK